MFEACFNNKFTNALVYYLSILFLFLISPFLFIWELVNTLRLSFQCTENMSQKVVLITGASSGLGELMAYEYAKKGACLAIIATKRPESRLKQVADKARELGSPDVLVMFADVSNVDECRMFVDDTIRHFGRLDHLVTNAGIAPLYSVNIDVTKFAPVMDINFWGSIYPTHFAIPHLQKTRGKIVVNASSCGVLHIPQGGFYAIWDHVRPACFRKTGEITFLHLKFHSKNTVKASKAALIGFYESLRFEVSPTISITILTLGFIQTNLLTANYSTNGVGVHLREDFRNVFPVMEADVCAKVIVEGVCKGVTSITEPRFIKTLFFIKFLFPELHRFIFDGYQCLEDMRLFKKD